MGGVLPIANFFVSVFFCAVNIVIYILDKPASSHAEGLYSAAFSSKEREFARGGDGQQQWRLTFERSPHHKRVHFAESLPESFGQCELSFARRNARIAPEGHVWIIVGRIVAILTLPQIA